MKIAIIGGGITGLVLAYLLSRNNQITIFESAQTLGGLADTIKIEGNKIEKFYHHIFTNDKDLIDLLTELGINNKLRWHETDNALYLNNYIPFSTAWDLLKLSELNIVDKIRLGLMTLSANKNYYDKLLDKITAKNWVIKNAGSNVYRFLWEPLLKSKFDDEADNISALWLKNKIKLRGRSRRQIFSKETFGYIDGSLSILIDALTQRIKENHGKIVLNKTIEKMIWKKTGILIENQRFDRVIFTGPDTKFNKILTTRINNKPVKYMANVCAIFLLKKSFSKYYWTTILDDGFPFIALIEQTNMIKNHYRGKKLLYVSRYLKADNPLFNMTDVEIKNIFFKFLLKINPKFKKQNILAYKIFKAQYAQPVINKNYFKTIKPFETKYKNIYLVNMTQIYPEDRGINYAIKLAKRATKEIFDE